MQYEMEDLLEFVGEKNTKKIKDGLTNAILANLEESVAEQWFVNPDTLQELLGESFNRLYKKHRKEIDKVIEEKMLELIEEISNKKS